MAYIHHKEKREHQHPGSGCSGDEIIQNAHSQEKLFRDGSWLWPPAFEGKLGRITDNQHGQIDNFVVRGNLQHRMSILRANVPGAQYTYLLQISVKHIIYINCVTCFLTLYLNQPHLFMFNLTKILFAGILGDENDYGNGYGIAFAREQAGSCCYLTLLSWRKETMTSPSDVRSRRHLYPLSGARVLMLLVLLGVLMFALTVRTARAATGQAFVRVNQVGYATTASKRAYLMASGVETGATFSVKNASGATVYSAAIGANLGSWSSSYPDVYALDFGTLTTPGTYTIAASGPIAGTSPAFVIDSAANVYAKAMANALSFYQNERDGANYIPSALRTAPGHLNDANAMTYLTPNYNAGSGRFSGDLTALGVTINGSGGWWDAGDYVKFVETTSYTVDILQLGVRDFANQLGAGSSSANFTAETKFGLDFLQNMWNDSTQTLYYQVGIGEGNAKTTGDHDIWRLPQADDTYGGTSSQDRYIRNRPVFRAAPAGALISPNLAGRLAGDFALCFQIFKTSNPAYANQCLLSAEHIFGLANTNPSGNLLTAIPFSFYPETEWRDDLEFGATELYFALAGGNLPAGLPQTNPLFYLQSAATWAHAYITGPNDAADTLNLYDVSGAAHYELYRAMAQAGNPAGLAVTQADLLTDLKKQLDKAVAQGASDAFGFGFPWSNFDTTSHGAGLVVMASEYDHLTGSSAYASYGVQWLANILGANAWGISLLVGDGTTFPHCMQHQVANLAGSLDGSAPILAGAAVEGPNGTTSRGLVSGMVTCPANGVDQFAPFNSSSATFQDNVQSWSTDEPAIDLTATSPLAFAWQTAN